VGTAVWPAVGPVGGAPRPGGRSDTAAFPVGQPGQGFPPGRRGVPDAGRIAPDEARHRGTQEPDPDHGPERPAGRAPMTGRPHLPGEDFPSQDFPSQDFPSADFPSTELPRQQRPAGRRGGHGDAPPDVGDHPDWAGDDQHPGFFQGFGEDDGVDPPRRRRGRWAAPLISLIVIVVVLAAAGIVGARYYAGRHANYVGSGKGRVVVKVGSGASATTLAPGLVKDGVIKATAPFIAAAKESPKSGDLVPGTFALHKHMNAALAWALLVNPSSRIQTTVSVVDGARATTIIASLAKQTGKPLSQFKAALANTKALHLPASAHGKPEGYLFPATYNFPPGTTPLQMLQAMVQKFDSEATSLNLAADAKKAQFTVAQVITEASLLEAEVDPGDYPKAARVIDNRLNSHPEMTLGLDSTVLYALNLPGTFSLTKHQLATGSPYNTTNHLGLPPGPIDSPSVKAIEAALHPAAKSNNWLYFVTIDPKTGRTGFTHSFTQFQKWSRESAQNIKNGT
jgi:UPF0755 protein